MLVCKTKKKNQKVDAQIMEFVTGLYLTNDEWVSDHTIKKRDLRVESIKNIMHVHSIDFINQIAKEIAEGVENNDYIGYLKN